MSEENKGMIEKEFVESLIAYQNDICNSFKKRAEAAEAKLTELDKQDPAAFTSEHYWSELNDFGAVKCVLLKNGTDPDFQVEFFTRPAPAVSLAELVPDEMPEAAYSIMSDKFGDGACMISDDMWKACRAAILRNIEEAK